jgi:hypothetical protein
MCVSCKDDSALFFSFLHGSKDYLYQRNGHGFPYASGNRRMYGTYVYSTNPAAQAKGFRLSIQDCTFSVSILHYLFSVEAILQRLKCTQI